MQLMSFAVKYTDLADNTVLKLNHLKDEIYFSEIVHVSRNLYRNHEVLTLLCIIFQNGQAHFKSLPANAAKL